MTARSDFSDEEWERLGRAPLVAAMAITLADPGGPIETVKESNAALKTILDELRAVYALLLAKATREDVDGFREWLRTASQRAALAAKEGGVLGIGGERVSAREQQMLETLG